MEGQLATNQIGEKMILTLFHGTTANNAKSIVENGFETGTKSNWKVKSKPNFVYLSSAYAPFYAMAAGGDKLALIKCKVSSKNIYPEDDFLMIALGKNVYSQEELDEVDFEKYKYLANQSLRFMGNVAAKPEDVRVIGMREFSGRMLVMVCDPVISPMNFKIMGGYYKRLSEHIFKTGEFKTFDRRNGIC